MKKDIEMNKKLNQNEIEMNKKDIEMNKKDIEIGLMRVERDNANKLLDLTYTEELKSYRDTLAAKRQAETRRANE